MSSTEPSRKKALTPHLTDEVRHSLIEAAQTVRQHAYAPYSDYLVGAALLTNGGAIYTGCNVENAAFSPTICAERVALVKAISEGEREFEAIAVVTDNGAFPCGLCRQMMYEFSPLMTVIVVDAEGIMVNESTLAELLPKGFTPDQVHKHGTA